MTNQSLKKGMTLAEILLVIFIISILFAIPFWGGTRWIQRNRLRNEAVKIRALLENERTTAMASNARRAVVFNGRNVEIRAEVLTHPLPNYDSIVATYSNYINPRINLGGLTGANALHGGTIDSDGIMFGTGTGAQNDTVRFTPFGLCETPGEIYINDGRNLMCVEVNAFGQVRTYSWRGQWIEEK
uniref:Prepilin-type N-terminal cleavage/methylation domain-containing protein n=1 Tax=candidate division WOR-3 bacterium TaxID=2052148 RepID=A0A7C2K362_UNCW3